MYQQVKELNIKNILLILLSTASVSVLHYYEEPVYIAYKSGHRETEKWIERRIANLKGTVIYNIGNGARIEGVPCRTWAEMMGE